MTDWIKTQSELACKMENNTIYEPWLFYVISHRLSS